MGVGAAHAKPLVHRVSREYSLVNNRFYIKGCWPIAAVQCLWINFGLRHIAALERCNLKVSFLVSRRSKIQVPSLLTAHSGHPENCGEGQKTTLTRPL